MILIGTESKFCLLRIEILPLYLWGLWGLSKSFWRNYFALGLILVSWNREEVEG